MKRALALPARPPSLDMSSEFPNAVLAGKIANSANSIVALVTSGNYQERDIPNIIKAARILVSLIGDCAVYLRADFIVCIFNSPAFALFSQYETTIIEFLSVVIAKNNLMLRFVLNTLLTSKTFSWFVCN